MNDRNAPLCIAVVGHTNAGKTSLLRTLTRRADFGEVSDRPGTTRHVERIDLRVEGQAAVRFFDTPGLEDAVALLALVQTLEGPSRPDRIRRFLAGPEAHGVFEQEAKVLRAVLEVDAAFLVIDAREAVLPKYRDEVELLGACGKPVMPVLNFVAHSASREAQWRSLLADSGLHAVVRFDAAAPFTGAERDLYQDLCTLLPAQRGALQRIVAHLHQEASARRSAACRLIAEGMVEIAAMRREIDADLPDTDPARLREVQSLRDSVTGNAQRRIQALLALHGFRADDATEAPLPMLQGRDALDLFNPETLRQAGRRLGQGAVVGATVGVVADLAVGGLSLGAGAALGGALGGALAQGWGPLGRRVVGRLRGLRELSVEDSVLYVMADQQLRLLAALEQRGHGSPPSTIHPASAAAPAAQDKALSSALHAAQSARARPEWASDGDRSSRNERSRTRALVLQKITQSLEAAAAAWNPGP